jgi:hypothetical protein
MWWTNSTQITKKKKRAEDENTILLRHGSIEVVLQCDEPTVNKGTALYYTVSNHLKAIMAV